MAAIFAQSSTSNTGSDARTNVIFAIDRLKEKSPNPVTAEELIAYVLPAHRREDTHQVDLFRQFLKVNAKVKYDPKTDSYTFRPLHNIYKASDLLAYLQAQDTALGISVRDLKDGWPNVEDTIDELEKQHRLLVTRNKKDNHPRMVWADDPTLVAPLDPEYKELWEKIALPLPEDIIRDLRREGFKSAGEVAEKKAPSRLENKKKKIRRGAKVTNTHMQGMFRDYSSKQPQAGK